MLLVRPAVSLRVTQLRHVLHDTEVWIIVDFADPAGLGFIDLACHDMLEADELRLHLSTLLL